MIAAPSGWKSEPRQDGLVLYEDRARAIVRYVERKRPLRRTSELVAAASRPEGFVAAAPPTTPERMITREGEYAALVSQRGRVGDAGVQLVWGFVFLDDSYAALSSIAFSDHEMIESTVRELIVGDCHRIGRLRRRRFVYDAPAGWHGMATATDTTWYPLDYPANRARIIVNEAVPGQVGIVASLLARMIGSLARLASATLSPVELVHTPRGLAGEHHHLRIEPNGLHSHVWFLCDDDFVYSLRVDGDAHVGRVLVDSIEPIPRANRPSQRELLSIMESWVG